MASRKDKKAAVISKPGPAVVLRGGNLPRGPIDGIERDPGAAKYSWEKSERICEMISQGWTAPQISRDPSMPSYPTIYTWRRKSGEAIEKNAPCPYDDFYTRYARALILRTEYFAEQIPEIADDGTNDWIEKEYVTRGGEKATYKVLNHEHISRSRLRIEARQWLMSKLNHKQYGNKVDVMPQNPDGSNLMPTIFGITFDNPGAPSTEDDAISKG
jgi:hypothetical protein